MKMYDKLVRDQIPKIIEQNGGKCVIRIVNTDMEKQILLRKKLIEEFEEYCANPTLEELADITEVVFALARDLGFNQEDLLNAADRKRAERGGFEAGIVLISTE